MMKCLNNRCWCVQLGNMGVSACLMAAFSGFYESLEHPPLGDARDSTAASR